MHIATPILLTSSYEIPSARRVRACPAVHINKRSRLQDFTASCATMANLSTVFALVVLCWSTFAAATHNSYHKPSPAAPLPFETLVGTVCFPPFGFRARTCGDYEVLEESSEMAFINVYG